MMKIYEAIVSKPKNILPKIFCNVNFISYFMGEYVVFYLFRIIFKLILMKKV